MPGLRCVSPPSPSPAPSPRCRPCCPQPGTDPAAAEPRGDGDGRGGGGGRDAEACGESAGTPSSGSSSPLVQEGASARNLGAGSSAVVERTFEDKRCSEVIFQGKYYKWCCWEYSSAQLLLVGENQLNWEKDTGKTLPHCKTNPLLTRFERVLLVVERLAQLGRDPP